jgi:TonB-linked SusC/RagA family outer membrane protein
MMRTPRSGPILLGSLSAFLVLAASPLSAQQGAVISGRVTTQTGDPLGGANVVVANSNFGAVTGPNGAYSIAIGQEAVRGQTLILTVRFIGYKPGSRSITLSAGSQEQNFQLQADPLRLEEVVVTGVAEATSLKKLPFAVGRVTDEQLQQVPGQSALVALEGKIAGVRLVPTSAQPGGEVSLRLRGATSIGGRQDPLIIVDGVITRFGLSDVSGQDVERVEVVKGAAASSLYGSDAANGVVQIFTKRGNSLADGAVRVTSRVEAGSNSMPRRLQFSHSHAWEINPDTSYILNAQGGRIVETDGIADNPFKVYYDMWDALVARGVFWTGYTSVGQRQGNTNFNVSFENTRNEGVIFGLGGYNRQNFRVNVDHQLRPNLDASFSTFYGRSGNGRTEEGQNGPFFGLMFLQPDVNVKACCNPDGSPYIAKVPQSGDVANDFNPLYELANRTIDQDRNRFTGSAKARWRIKDWLQAEGSVGYDQEANSYRDVRPFGFLTSSGTTTLGSLTDTSRNDWQYNGSVTLTSIRHLGSRITNTTKVAAIFEDQRNRMVTTTANAFKQRGVPEFYAADQAQLSANSWDQRTRNENFFAVSTFDINDRYILDGLVRRDASSLFGAESRWATYFRMSGAWRLTEDVHIPGIDEWRLRASYGTAGLRPGFDYQYEILRITNTGADFNVLGNPLLKPARSAELELGTNMETGSGRYSLEYTYSQKSTKDQIILVDLSVAGGGFPFQWQNVGALRARSHELTLAARLINSPGTTLQLNIVGDRTRQVITDWPLGDRQYSFQQMPATFFLGKGSDLGVMYGNHWVRNINELYDDPTKTNACPGTWCPDSLMINEDGYVIRKSVYGTIDERAIKYVFCKIPGPASTCAGTSNFVQIGNANPDFNLSFNLSFTHRRFAVNATLDGSFGGDLYNGTRQWAFQATRDRVQSQAGKPKNAAVCTTVGTCPQKALGYYGVGFYNGLDPNDYFIEDGSYMKLKELGLSYTFVSDQLRKLGLRGLHEVRLGFNARNLFTITNYSGLDPEVSGLFGDPFQVRMDWFQYPQFRTFSAVVEITY